MGQLGKYFTLHELTLSQTATRANLPNIPNQGVITCLYDLVGFILDPLRERLGKPVVVSSGYRSEHVNALVGGSATSQHCLGQAADITVPGMCVADLADTLRKFNLPFDQLIDEFGAWVHVSYSPRQRRQALVARTIRGKTVYSPMDSL